MSDVLGTTINLRPARRAVKIEPEPEMMGMSLMTRAAEAPRMLTSMADNQITLGNQLVDLVTERERFNAKLASWSLSRWRSFAVLNDEFVKVSFLQCLEHRPVWLEDVDEVVEESRPDGH
jgi:hypothetical protein